MVSEVILSAGIRSTLNALRIASTNLDLTTKRISSGLKVSGPLDSPTAFFDVLGLTQRADSFAARKDDIGLSISLLESVDAAITSIQSLIASAKVIAQAAEDGRPPAALQDRGQLQSEVRDGGAAHRQCLGEAPA